MKTEMLPPSAHQEQMPSTGLVSAFPPGQRRHLQPMVCSPTIHRARSVRFDFDRLEESTPSGSEHTPTGSDETMTTRSYAVTPNWTESLHHPVANAANQSSWRNSMNPTFTVWHILVSNEAQP